MSKFEEDRFRNKKVHSLVNMVVGVVVSKCPFVHSTPVGGGPDFGLPFWERLVLRSDALARTLILRYNSHLKNGRDLIMSEAGRA